MGAKCLVCRGSAGVPARRDESWQWIAYGRRDQGIGPPRCARRAPYPRLLAGRRTTFMICRDSGD
jgi:hypothetical protein